MQYDTTQIVINEMHCRDPIYAYLFKSIDLRLRPNFWAAVVVALKIKSAPEGNRYILLFHIMFRTSHLFAMK